MTDTPEQQARWNAARDLYGDDAKRREHAYNVFALFGLEIGEYDQILKAQNGVCAICGRPPAQIRLHVDHHHQCGRKKTWRRQSVRGLLCSNCNRGILRENPDLLRTAAAYFQQHLDVCPARSKAAV